MPRMGRDTFARVIVSDGAGHYVRLPRLTTTQRDALTAVEGMMIANSTTDTIQGYINSAWRNMDAQMLAAYLPLTGGTLTGDLSIGAHKLKTTTLYIYEYDTTTFGLKRIADDADIFVRAALFKPTVGVIAQGDAAYLAANDADTNYLTLKARDTGSGLAEVARLQGATVAHLLLTRAKFSTAAHAADVNHRGFLYFTEGTAGTEDKLYCIMKGDDDGYDAILVAQGTVA